MYDGPVETIEYMWANIWCMLDWTVSTGDIGLYGSVKVSKEVQCSDWGLFPSRGEYKFAFQF